MPSNYTREEALNLAVVYLDEARDKHEKAAANRMYAWQAANAIELSKAFMMLHDRLPHPPLRDVRQVCGINHGEGPCVLARGHNMGQADVPSAHLPHPPK